MSWPGFATVLDCEIGDLLEFVPPEESDPN